MGTRIPSAFRPNVAGTLAMAVTAATSNLQLDPSNNGGASEYRIYNAGPQVAYVDFGKSNAITASVPAAGGVAGSMPIPPGAVEFFRPPVVGALVADYWLAAVTPTGAATLYISPGEGN